MPCLVCIIAKYRMVKGIKLNNSQARQSCTPGKYTPEQHDMNATLLATIEDSERNLTTKPYLCKNMVTSNRT